MESVIWWAFLWAVMPGVESRLSIPILYNYFQGLPPLFWFYYFIVVALNSVVVLAVFVFLEFLHHHLMDWRLYHNTFGKFVEKKKKTAEKVQKKMHNFGYVALVLFVAIPLTGQVHKTATVVAWILGLSKRKSFVAISLGVFLASLVTLAGTLLFFNGLSHLP